MTPKMICLALLTLLEVQPDGTFSKGFGSLHDNIHTDTQTFP
jgi:hypothetical protein